MKQLSKWAFQHKFQAQSLIAIVCTVLYTFSVFLGYALLGAEMKCPFYVFETLGVLAFIVSLMYPSKHAKDDRNTLTHWYIKTRIYHFLMFFLTALLFCSGGNYLGQWATKPIENTQISTVFSDISFGKNNLDTEKNNQLENLKKRISTKISPVKTHIRKNIVRSTHFFGTKKKERSYQQYFLYFSLLTIASWVLGIFACNAACSGFAIAALILVPAALTSSVFAIIFLLKAFRKLSKRNENNYPVFTMNKTLPFFIGCCSLFFTSCSITNYESARTLGKGKVRVGGSLEGQRITTSGYSEFPLSFGPSFGGTYGKTEVIDFSLYSTILMNEVGMKWQFAGTKTSKFAAASGMIVGLASLIPYVRTPLYFSFHPKDDLSWFLNPSMTYGGVSIYSSDNISTFSVSTGFQFGTRKRFAIGLTYLKPIEQRYIYDNYPQDFKSSGFNIGMNYFFYYK
jgi:hypothetical protein